MATTTKASSTRTPSTQNNPNGDMGQMDIASIVANSATGQKFTEFAVQLNALLAMTQKIAELQSTPYLANIISPQLFNGLMGALKAQSLNIVRNMMGEGSWQAVQDQAAQHGWDATTGRYAQDEMERSLHNRDRYQQALQNYRNVRYNTMDPRAHTDPESWSLDPRDRMMNPATMEHIMKTTNSAQQESLLDWLRGSTTKPMDLDTLDPDVVYGKDNKPPGSYTNKDLPRDTPPASPSVSTPSKDTKNNTDK